jgi:predicted nucleic acid-binding protein
MAERTEGPLASSSVRAGLIDTDILIDVLQGIPDAAVFITGLQEAGEVCISIVSKMELIPGCRNQEELRQLQAFLQDFTLLPITPSIAEVACQWLETFALSHGLRMPDALIAATAAEHHLTLYTRNIRHFQMLPDLDVRRPY